MARMASFFIISTHLPSLKNSVDKKDLFG